jgi:signal transduction histidine kinase
LSYFGDFIKTGQARFYQFKLRSDSRRVLIWVMVLAAGGFITASALFNATNRHATALQFWSKQISHLTLVLAEQANQSLFSAEVVLDTLSDDMIEQAVQADQNKNVVESDQILRKLLQEKVQVNRLIEAISVVLPGGRVVSSSDGQIAPFEVELHKREFVQISPRFSSAVFLGTPRFDGQTRKWLFDLLREVKNRDGSTFAWLRVEVSLQSFFELYEKVVKDLGRGASVSLYRSDYTLMARWPSVEALIGVQNLNSATQNLIGVQKLTQGVLVTDSERLTEAQSTDLRMVAVRRVDQFPLIVTSVITRDLFLKEWDDVVRKIVWRSSLALLLLGLGAWWLLRSDTRLQLELRDRLATQEALRKAHEELESRVLERTRALRLEVAERRRVERELVSANALTYAISHRAGMAEVANSVLHNVGNVLNSANVSALILYEQHKTTSLKDFPLAISLMTAHQNDLAQYLLQDPQGRQIPDYLKLLAEVWEAEYANAIKELEQLMLSMQHIKEIVARQQSLSGQGGLKVRMNLKDVLRDAISFLAVQLKESEIEVALQVGDAVWWTGDRIKLTQIILNIVMNGQQAIMASVEKNIRKLQIQVSQSHDHTLRIDFTDNGIGMTEATLNGLFSYGFTTKENGHGLGLHASAVAAHEMGGTLTAHSDGMYLGSTFSLTLPIDRTAVQPEQVDVS